LNKDAIVKLNLSDHVGF